MVSVLVSGSSGLGSSPGQGHCVVFLGKTLYSHSAFPYPGVSIGAANLTWAVILRWTNTPSREE